MRVGTSLRKNGVWQHSIDYTEQELLAKYDVFMKSFSSRGNVCFMRYLHTPPPSFIVHFSFKKEVN